jgi:mannose-6-phosphate isomerase
MPGKIVEKPWGYYQVIEDQPSYKIKRLVILSGQAISLQRHHQREEGWIAVKGKGWITLGNASDALFSYELKAGVPVGIKKGMIHRMRNNEAEELVIIEVQTGKCKEDDIERIEDDYGRE